MNILRDSILDVGERIQRVAPLQQPNVSVTQPYLEWKGIETKQYLQAIYTLFSKIRKFEVHSVYKKKVLSLFLTTNKI